MVSIQGFGGVSGPSGSRPPQRQAQAQVSTGAPSTDAVDLSSEARAAAEASAMIRQAADNDFVDFVREDRINEAKENMRQGVHRIQQVVLQVAARLSQFVE